MRTRDRIQATRVLSFKFQVSGFKFQVSGFKVMEKVRSFEDLLVFQKARVLCKEVYRITDANPFKNDYRFVQQIRAAAGSIMDNIAEWYERDGNKEFINFLYIAKGSCGEVRSQIIRASDVGFIDTDTSNTIYQDCLEVARLLSSFIASIKNSGITGKKYVM